MLSLLSYTRNIIKVNRIIIKSMSNYEEHPNLSDQIQGMLNFDFIFFPAH